MSGIFCCSGRQDDHPVATQNGAVLSGVARYEVNAVADVISGAVSTDSDRFAENGSRFPENGTGFSEGGFAHQHLQQRQFWLPPSSRAPHPPPPPPPPALPDVVGHSAVFVGTASSQQHTMSPEAFSRPFW